MRSVALLLLTVSLAGTGCEAIQLRDRTVRQARTLADLHERQVMDNFARLGDDPAALPSYAVANQGTTGIQQTGTMRGELDWDYTLLMVPAVFVNSLDKKTLGLEASQQNIEQWNTTPILDPDRLKLMRYAYQKVLGVCPPDPDLDQQLNRFFKDEPQFLSAIRPGWVKVGGLKELPRHSAHMGRSGKTVAWVCAENSNDLSWFTLAILDIATIAPPPPPPTTSERLKAAIKEQEQRVKTIADVYSKLDDKSPDKYLLGLRLHVELGYLNSMYSGAPPEQKADELKVKVHRYASLLEAQLEGNNAFSAGAKSSLIGELKGMAQSMSESKAEEIKSLHAAPLGATSTSELRPRLNFNTFAQPPVVVPFPP